MSRIWFVRAGRESIYAEDFIQKKVVAIGWVELGELPNEITKSNLLQRYKETYPDAKEGRAQSGISQILRFMHEIEIGDAVMTYDRDKQMYYLGVVSSDCIWRPELIVDLPRARKVEWRSQIHRSHLSSDTRNTLGAIMTLFLVQDKAAAEIQGACISIQQEPAKIDVSPTIQKTAMADQKEREREVQAELLEKSEQAIEDRIVSLEWDQVQELVAGILRAMGYRTTISPRGSDRGVDIFASPDGLGLEEPRIFVEVKNRPTTSMGAQEIRSFLGGRSARDKCLYVSTGGFTKDARYEGDRANIPIMLLGLVDLRKLFLEYYEKMDEEARSLIPLKRVYVLAD